MSHWHGRSKHHFISIYPLFIHTIWNTVSSRCKLRIASGPRLPLKRTRASANRLPSTGTSGSFQIRMAAPFRLAAAGRGLLASRGLTKIGMFT